MLKTLLHFRNPDSTQDIITLLSKFFTKGIVEGGLVQTVWPNSTPQVTVSPFKLIGEDGMVVMETSDTKLITLPTNQTTVILFKSKYITNGPAEVGFEQIEISAYNAFSEEAKRERVVFATVQTGGATDQPIVRTDLRNALDPVGRDALRGWLSSKAALPAVGNRYGDLYIVESGQPNPDNGIYVWKGSAAWVNVTESLALSNTLAQHRANLKVDEVHLTNKQADAALGSYGAPDDTNRYVTSLDPRFPSLDENEALQGVSQAVPVPPSNTNRYVTGAYTLPQINEITLQPSALLGPAGIYIPLQTSSGPVFVGIDGATMADALKYFGIFSASNPTREYTNSAGQPVRVIGIYKSITPETELHPLSEQEVLDTNGAWASTALYLKVDAVIDTPIILRYGQMLPLKSINRGFPLRGGPKDAQTAAEVLKRMADISGRQIDDPVQAGESNKELRGQGLSLRRYLNTATTSDMIVAGTSFSRLRKVPDIAPDFVADLGEIVLYNGLASYTVQVTNAEVSAFDNLFTEDVPYVAVIKYAAGTVLPAILPGQIWQDDAGRSHRILAYNAATFSLLVYTGGATINLNNNPGNQSRILRNNNPRRLELLTDHQLTMYREHFQIEGITPVENGFEAMPPGGVHVGQFQPANNFSLIGTSLLPNQGNPDGATRGRSQYYITPNVSGNRPERRLILVGAWRTASDHPRQALGDLSQGSLGIEFTGRLSSLTLFTVVTKNMPYGFRVFVDGVYNHSASQLLTSADIASGLVASKAIEDLRGVQEKTMMPIVFNNLGLTDNLIHTVRIEVTKNGSTNKSFPLYAVETYYAGAIESSGRSFVSTDFVKTETPEVLTTPVATSPRGLRTIRYMDRVTKLRKTVSSSMPQATSTSVQAVSGVATISDSNLANQATAGDVFSFVSRNPNADSTFQAYRRVASVDRTAGTLTLDQALSFALPQNSIGRAEFLFKIPTAATGVPTIGAPANEFSEEYARLQVKDWSVGTSRDIAALGTGLPDNRVTVLDDGVTALSVFQCRRVLTGIEGFDEAVRLEALDSFMVMNAWCTRMDVVFAGSGNAPSTVVIEIDGQISYTLSVPNDGVVRHTLFSSGAPQVHTVKISTPSAAGTVAVGQWIFHTIKAPATDGALIAEYETPRNATAAGISQFDFASTALTNPLVVSNAGVRIFDITKYGAKIYDGSTGTLDWRVVQDFANNPRFGRYIETDRLNAILEARLIGTHIEIIYLAGPNKGKTQIYLDGIVASGGNFPSRIYGPGYDVATGSLDMYSATEVVRRLVLTNLTMGEHILRMQNMGPGNSNASSSGSVMTCLALAENPGTYVVNRRSAESTKANRIHAESFRDLRQFLSISGDQLAAGSSGEDEAVTTAAAITIGYLNAAFAMSDSSGTALNCTVGTLAGLTIVDLAIPFTPALNPGLPVGDLDVYVDGAIIPRKIQGVTQDAWYEEDSVTTGRLKFWANLSTTSLTIDIRRKSGTTDSKDTNAGRLLVLNGTVVGSAAQAAAGLADYSSLAAAITGATVGQKITVLPGYNRIEDVVLDKRLTIVGTGYDSRLVGTLSLTSAVQFATIQGLHVNQFIINGGATGNQIIDSFWTTDPTDVNAFGQNRITGIRTV